MVAFGMLAANYTTEGKAPFHRQWAVENGMPEPSDELFHLGLGVEVLGLVVLFMTWTRKRA